MQTPHMTEQVILIIFTAVTSIGVLLQASVLAAIYFGARRALRRANELTEQMSTHVLPALATTRSLLEDISPKLKVASTNLVESSHTIRHQTQHIDRTVEELVEKARHQVDRVDDMVAGTLDGILRATSALQHGVSVPVRRISGILAGVRAGIDSLRSGGRDSRIHDTAARDTAARGSHAAERRKDAETNEPGSESGAYI